MSVMFTIDLEKGFLVEDIVHHVSLKGIVTKVMNGACKDHSH